MKTLTPKEKAYRLVTSFEILMSLKLGSNSMIVNINDCAIHCALKVVNEIMKCELRPKLGRVFGLQEKEYWQQVKKEINLTPNQQLLK